MTAFVHTNYPEKHPGVSRAEAVGAAWSGVKSAAGRNFTAPRSLAAFLLGAFLSALILVADQFIDAFANGHLLATWIAMWLYVFAAMALLAPAAKRSAVAILKWAKEASARADQRRAEAMYLETAQRDPRVMAELQAAILRHEAIQIERFGAVEPNAALERLTRSLPPSKRYLRYV